MEKLVYYQGMVILCQSYHGDYACILGGVATLDNAGTDCST
jgi:hypothetical protein